MDDEFKVRPSMQRRSATDNRQTAAPFRTVQRECPNDQVATGAHGSQNSFDIGRTLARIGSKNGTWRGRATIVRLARFHGAISFVQKRIN
jgi:hypothetical protein